VHVVMAGYLNRHLSDKQLVLASASPRRAELLRSVGLNFRVVPSTFGENLSKDLSPPDYAKMTAVAKGRDVFRALGSGQDLVVVAADTVVDLDRQILEKPVDEEDARRMLLAMSDRSHQVHTGVAIVHGGGEKAFTCSTTVKFVNLRPESVEAYIASGSPMDKAGAYGVQDMWMVDEIVGCYFNVVGLPVSKTIKALEEI
jgi:septum formation protein